jgi:hypothetical protein
MEIFRLDRLRDLENKDPQDDDIREDFKKVSCNGCSNALWQETNKGIVAFCESTKARVFICDAKEKIVKENT